MAVPAALALIPLAMGILSGLGFLFPPLGRWSHQFQNEYMPNELPDIITLSQISAKGVLDEFDFKTYARKLGFDEFYSYLVRENYLQHLSPIDYVMAHFRGIISKEDLTNRLNRCALSSKDQTILKEYVQYFPSVPDLVRFAVREVYNSDVVDKFGQMENLPDKFVEEAEKAGLPEEQAKNYWAAHWNLPSVSQGFEMLHRRVIDDSTLNMLLRALDVMPYWREKLTEISYNPLTRVDVRRMYGLGVLDVDDVYNSYLDVGYSPENAKRMTEFTIKYENDEMNGLTRATLVNSYKDGIIDRDQLRSYLKGFRYTDDVITFWLDQADYEKTLEDIKIYTKDLTELYQKGAISIDDMRTFLNQMDLPSKYIDTVLNKTILAKAPKTKIPTLESLMSWLEERLISESYFTEQMRALGYRDKDIRIYLEVVAIRVDTSKRRYMPVETYQRWLILGIISKDDFRETLGEMGVNEDDIDAMMAELKVSIYED